jgi:hypothetical protein
MEDYGSLTAEQQAILTGLREGRSQPSGHAMDGLYKAGLVAFDRLWGAYELTPDGEAAADYLLEADPDAPADTDYDLESAAGAERIDLAPTWMVTACEDCLRLVRVESGLPNRQYIPRRYMGALAIRLTVRRQAFITEPLPPTTLRVKRELISFGQPETSDPYAGSPG